MHERYSDWVKPAWNKAPHNILIIDDDQTTCEMLDILLRNKGYSTAIAYSGRDAITWVEKTMPDLILLDVVMPNMNGWETFAKLRCLTNSPIIFLSALSSIECAAHGCELGASDFIRKPFMNADLIARIDAQLVRAQKNKRYAPAQFPKIAVVIPAFNEERFIGSVVLKARHQAHTVIVIDDGSSDCTAQIASEAGALVITHPHNQGKGAALNTAFKAVCEYHPDVVVMLDGDGQHLPEELAQVVQPILNQQADIVIGSRYLPYTCQNRHHQEKWANNPTVPRNRVLGHRAFNWITHIASGVAVTDSQSGYRAFSPRAIEVITFNSNGFSVESEMQFIAHENNLKLVEVPVTIRYQDPPKRSVITQGLDVLNGILHLVGQYRPLLFFGVPGLFFMLGGLGWGVWITEIYTHSHQLAIGYGLICILMSMLGLMFLSTGLILHSVRGLLIGLLQHNHS